MKKIETIADRTSKSIPDLLSEVKLRPGMFLGETSLLALEAFLTGFAIAEDIYQIPDSKKLSGFSWNDFEKWVDEKYNPKRLSVRSFYHARQRSSSDEEAFHKWFEIYEEYLTTKNPLKALT